MFIGATIVLAIAVGIVWMRAGDARSIPVSAVSHVHGIAVDPTDSARLFLATHNGLYRTSPDGTAVRASDSDDDYMGFTPHPTDASLIYASGHPATGGNMGVIVSKDGGERWTQLSPGTRGPVDFHAITVSRADPNVLYGTFGGIQVSRDGGKTWSTGGLAPADVIDLAASAANPDIVYAATAQGLMVSRDAGKTWEVTVQQGQPATMVETGPDGTVYAFVIGLGLIKSPGAALSWRPVSKAFGDQVVLHLAADPADPLRLFAVTDAGRVLNSTDGGQRWTPFT